MNRFTKRQGTEQLDDLHDAQQSPMHHGVPVGEHMWPWSELGICSKKCQPKSWWLEKTNQSLFFFGSTTILDVAYMPLVGEIRWERRKVGRSDDWGCRIHLIYKKLLYNHRHWPVHHGDQHVANMRNHQEKREELHLSNCWMCQEFEHEILHNMFISVDCRSTQITYCVYLVRCTRIEFWTLKVPFQWSGYIVYIYSNLWLYAYWDKSWI